MVAVALIAQRSSSSDSVFTSKSKATLPRAAVAAAADVACHSPRRCARRAVSCCLPAFRQPLQRRDLAACSGGSRGNAGASRLPVDVKGARAAQAYAAAELGAVHLEHVVQGPQQRYVVRDIELARPPVHVQRDHSHSSTPSCLSPCAVQAGNGSRHGSAGSIDHRGGSGAIGR